MFSVYVVAIRYRHAGKSSAHFIVVLNKVMCLHANSVSLEPAKKLHCFLLGRTTNSDNVATYASNKKWREMGVKGDITKADKTSEDGDINLAKSILVR